MSMNVNVIQIDLSPCKEEVSNKVKLAWANKYPEVSNWIRAKKDKMGIIKSFMTYCKAVGYGDRPQDLLELRKIVNGRMSQDAIILLERFQEAYRKEYGNTPRIYDITKWVKSFYSFHDMAFPRQRAKQPYHKVRKKVQWSKEDLLKFVEGQDKRFRAMVSFLSCVPTRAETFINLKWYHVREVLDEKIDLPYVVIESELLKGEGYGQDIEQHSFLHSWAKKCLLEWKEDYEERTKSKILLSDAKSLDKPLWITYYAPFERLSKNMTEILFQNRSEECGLKVTIHSFRAFVNDALNTDDKDKKAVFLGHVSSYHGAYSMRMRENLKEVFLEAVPRLNPIYADKFKAKRDELDRLCEEGKLPSLSSEQKDLIARNFMSAISTLEMKFEKAKEELFTKFVMDLTVLPRTLETRREAWRKRLLKRH